MEQSIERQERITKARRRLDTLHDYIDVTPYISRRIGLMWEKAAKLDDGTGRVYEQCVNAAFRKFATQTF